MHPQYLVDLLIYSKTEEEHDRHVRNVLKRLRKYGLYAKLEKCSFDYKQVEFSLMDPAKAKTILEWQTPSSV
mgnify:FL=1